MITSQQLYEDSINKLFYLHLNVNNEQMTHKYDQQKLCRHHREKYLRHQNVKIHRNKQKNNKYDKYVY